jgi:hypothetical protein
MSIGEAQKRPLGARHDAPRFLVARLCGEIFGQMPLSHGFLTRRGGRPSSPKSAHGLAAELFLSEALEAAN